MEKVRISLMIDWDINERFRKRFVRKKGDISKIIEELMINYLKGGLK